MNTVAAEISVMVLFSWVQDGRVILEAAPCNRAGRSMQKGGWSSGGGQKNVAEDSALRHGGPNGQEVPSQG